LLESLALTQQVLKASVSPAAVFNDIRVLATEGHNLERRIENRLKERGYKLRIASVSEAQYTSPGDYRRLEHIQGELFEYLKDNRKIVALFSKPMSALYNKYASRPSGGDTFFSYWHDLFGRPTKLAIGALQKIVRATMGRGTKSALFKTVWLLNAVKLRQSAARVRDLIKRARHMKDKGLSELPSEEIANWENALMFIHSWTRPLIDNQRFPIEANPHWNRIVRLTDTMLIAAQAVGRHKTPDAVLTNAPGVLRALNKVQPIPETVLKTFGIV
jgi:hypothetical protein